jgi:hypothetical protein
MKRLRARWFLPEPAQLLLADFAGLPPPQQDTGFEHLGDHTLQRFLVKLAGQVQQGFVVGVQNAGQPSDKDSF